MVDQHFMNNSLYGDLVPEGDYYENPTYDNPIISECHLTEKMNSFYPPVFEKQDSLQQVPFEAFPDNEKMLIPGKFPGDPPMLVNAK